MLDHTTTDTDTDMPVLTLVGVLSLHGISQSHRDANGVVHEGADTAADNARETGVMYVCLGCGSIAGINPDDTGTYPTLEAARRATRDAIDWDCCGDTVVL